MAGLPERVRFLEEKGCFEEAVRLINKILTENEALPSALESRLEWEPERIERIKRDYALSWKDAFESLKNQI
ncbi:transglutaminase domain-containing protein, partial [Candidatus Bathyarchaeota archaeon]|nr:transglutaminase domain-containing protein [Candidatus Bathyarchaeota archaeon]